MPRIEIYDAIRKPYRIDTFDWDKIRAWLADWASVLQPPESQPDYPPLLMSIQPEFAYDWETGQSTPDWNADTRFFEPFEVPWEPDAIMARIEEQRQRIERAKAEGAKRL